jgi:hypothetical protein
MAPFKVFHVPIWPWHDGLLRKKQEFSKEKWHNFALEKKGESMVT